MYNHIIMCIIISVSKYITKVHYKDIFKNTFLYLYSIHISQVSIKCEAELWKLLKSLETENLFDAFPLISLEWIK